MDTSPSRPTTATAKPVDRVDEAWRWLTAELGTGPMPPLIVVVGLSDGALIDALDRHEVRTRVLALEPSPDDARRFLARPESAGWRRSGRLLYLVDPDYAGADQAWRLFSESGDVPPVLFHPGLSLGASVARAAQVLKRILFGVQANAEARRRLAPTYLLNSLRNIPGMLRGSDVRALTNRYANVPAIIAAAGPSLDAVVDRLQSAHEGALFLAADTALRPLLHAGATPHMVVAADPGAANARHFDGLPDCSSTWLVSESAVDLRATALFDGRTFWFRASTHHPWPWLRTVGIDVGQLDIWGSVLTAAFQVACLAGCDPIILVGADLAYTNQQPYCRGTTYEFDWAESVASGGTLTATWQAQMSRGDLIQASDLHGTPTTTTRTLVSFRDWMLARIAASGRRVINATGGGILFGESVEQAPLTDAPLRGRAIHGVETVARRLPDVRPSVVAAQLRQVRATLSATTAPPSPIPEWQAFCGHALDADAAGAALDAAVRAVETKQREPSLERWPLEARAIGSLWPRLADVVGDSSSAGPHDGARLAAAWSLIESAARAAPRDTNTAAANSEVTRWLALVLRTAMKGAADTHGPFPEFIRKPVQRHPATTKGNADAAATWHQQWFDWLTRVSELDHDGARALAEALAPLATSAAPDRASMALAVAQDRTLSLPLPTFVDEHAVARILTGAVRRSLDDPQRGVVVETPACRATLAVNAGASPASSSDAYARFLRPRVLTDEGVPTANLAYDTRDGVVCVPLQSRESVLVRSDGTSEPIHSWPLPIVGEVALGDDGAIAWGDGLAEWPEVRPGYLLVRATRRGDVEIIELPLRPTNGTWWNGRLYWSCFPRRVDTWTGLASWAPGEPVRLDVPNLPPVLGLNAHQTHLLLEPGGRPSTAGTWERRLETHGWRWRPGEAPTEWTLGAQGAASSRAVSDACTATAYPEADLVHVQSHDGRSIWLSCYYPYRLAWLGTSLLVSTMEREILLFEGLANIL